MAVTKRLYYGGSADPKHRQWLESTRQMLLMERATGKRTMTIIAAGQKTDKRIEVTIRTCLYEVEHDLCALFPDDYPPGVFMPIKHARPRYLY